jgi:hypothetical protein
LAYPRRNSGQSEIQKIPLLKSAESKLNETNMDLSEVEDKLNAYLKELGYLD